MRFRVNRHLRHHFRAERDSEIRDAPTAPRSLSPRRQPYPPEEFTWRDYCVFLLRIAAEIEHALMVQYLFAAYSIDGSKLPSRERHRVAAWRDIILGVAREEMGHLITVQNLLILLGSPVSLDREDYPWDSEFYPFTFHLRALSLESLATYICAESPPRWIGQVASAIRKRANAVNKGPANRVGELYALIGKVMNDPDRIRDADLQATTAPFQASWDEWGRGYRQFAQSTANGSRPNFVQAQMIIRRCSSRDEAVSALAEIGEQGEGLQAAASGTGEPGGSPEVAHFRRFLEIYRGLRGTSEPDLVALRIADNSRTDHFLDIARPAAP